FGTPHAIISDRDRHFCNDQFAKVMLKTVDENRASWSDKLDDALLAFCTALKTPIGYTSYKLVYGKACHLPIELEHKAYWALKHANFDFQTAGDHRIPTGSDEFPLPEKLHTAYEDKFPLLIQSDATVKKIALLLKTGVKHAMCSSVKGNLIIYTTFTDPTGEERLCNNER
nr:reverse transcriptase domain-containing protein [Tanacetum cinerariifolium]